MKSAKRQKRKKKEFMYSALGGQTLVGSRRCDDNYADELEESQRLIREIIKELIRQCSTNS